MSAIQQILLSSTGKNGVIGQAEYTTAGTFYWVCPVGETSVCVVAVGSGGGATKEPTQGNGGGGGGLGWKNDIPVTAGTSYLVVVGASAAENTDGSSSYFISNTTVCGFGGKKNGDAGSYVGDGGTPGGTGGNSNYPEYVLGDPPSGGGGGGAAGYNSGSGGKGGNGRTTYSLDVAGLQGSAGGGGTYGRGGGIGIYGSGTSGNRGGRGGSGGQDGVDGGKFGGGAGINANPSGSGAVRIIWGEGRAFPATRTVDE